MHFFVKEEYCAEGLILGRGGDPFIDCKMREKRTNLSFAHIIRVAFIVKEDESLDPMPVSLLSSQAIVLQANDVSNLVDEFGRTQEFTSS